MIQREEEQHFQQKEIEEAEIEIISALDFNLIIESKNSIDRETFNKMTGTQKINFSRLGSGRVI